MKISDGSDFSLEPAYLRDTHLKVCRVLKGKVLKTLWKNVTGIIFSFSRNSFIFFRDSLHLSSEKAYNLDNSNNVSFSKELLSTGNAGCITMDKMYVRGVESSPKC